MTLEKQKPSKIRILFVSHSSNLVGAEKSLEALLEKIDRNRFEPIVLIPKSGPLQSNIEYLNIKVYTLKCPWWMYSGNNIANRILLLSYCILREIVIVPRLLTILKKEKIDIVYTNTIVNFSGALSAKIAKKPHVWHIREIIINNPDLKSLLPLKFLFKLIVNMSVKIIANSNSTANQFHIHNLGTIISVVYNGIDINKFNCVSSISDIDDSIKQTDWLICVIGSLQRRKAQDDAIKAIRILKNKIPNIKLLLIGDGNKHFKKCITELIENLGVGNNISLLGYRKDVPQILQHCHILIVPSWNEPFGRVIIEAMAAGIPVIGVNNGGVKEIISDGITGYLIPSRNPKKIAEKIWFLYQHPSLAKKMGEAGMRSVEENYTIDQYVQNIEKIILELVN